MGGPGSGRFPKKTAAEHLLAGTYRRDRHGPKVVDLPRRPGLPPPVPADLSDEAAALWTRVTAEYDGWAPQDYVLLELGLRALDTAAQCRQAIGASGLTTPGGRPHPLLSVLRSEEKFVAETFRQLRLGR
jgi:hypothetical protein